MLRERFKEKVLSLAKKGEGESISDSSAFLLAVSGGIDSMTMAHLFYEIGYPSFAVATVNFSLRGEESDGDEKMVRDWCSSRGIECFVQKFDTQSYAKEHGISTQMAARDLRYQWFSTLCSQRGFSKLAIAHNLNDKAETLFINLLRGTGINGLSSIRETSHPTGEGMTVVRPIIEFSRREIEEFAKSENIPYRNDHTNFESHYSRNKLRNLVFPIFEEINPSFLQTIDREISIFTQAGDVINERLQEVREKVLSIITGGEESARISIPALKLFNNSEFWLYLLLEDYGFSASVVKDIHNSLESQSGKCFYSSDYQVLKDRNYLIVRSVETKMQPGRINDKVSLKFYDIYPLFTPMASDRIFYLDADLTGSNILFRKWRAGDKFTPLGMNGRKKVSDYLTDLKRDRFQKENRIVATTEDDKIICLLGERIDNNYRITKSTKRILEILLVD
jgi:tRNA(Ile)-lysidine synthase